MGLATLVWFSEQRIERARGAWRDPQNIVFDLALDELPGEGTMVRIVTDSHGQVESSSARVGKVGPMGDSFNLELDELTPFIRDRRSFERYPVELGVQFRLTDGDSQPWIEATTRNVSASGIFVATNARPPIGEIVELKLVIDSEPLEMKGWVVRYDDRARGIGLEFLEVEPMAYLELAGLISQLSRSS